MGRKGGKKTHTGLDINLRRRRGFFIGFVMATTELGV